MTSNYGIPIDFGYTYMNDPSDLRTIKDRPKEDPNTLMGKLANAANFGIFTNLIYFSGLDSVLRDTNSKLTIFAVPDRYILQNFQDTVRGLDSQTARYLIGYHILPYEYVINDMMGSFTYIKTMNPFYKLRMDGRGLSPQLGFRKQLTSTTPSMNFTPQILRGDIQGQNGILHIIDALMLPPPMANMEMKPYW